GDVWLVPVLRSRAIAIQAGENGGRTATYVNVVRGMQRLGHWAGQPISFEVPDAQAHIADADSWVVLLQGAADGRPGRIFGAAKGPGLWRPGAGYAYFSEIGSICRRPSRSWRARDSRASAASRRSS
ncbi:DUF1223 domain-containing protein, partial [Methylobacterium fujisawaense]